MDGNNIANLSVQLFGIFAPIVKGMIADHQAQNNGAMPTDEEIKAKFAADADRYLAEGAAWKTSHPDA